MSKSEISFHCKGRTDRSELHLIKVSGRTVRCSCQGEDWCSHIDATLVAGERHMVPEEDRPIADQAQKRLKGILKAPADWQASWKEDKVWRGLAAPRSGEAERMRWDGRPTVVFLGSGDAGNRAEYVDHAESLGWKVVEKPTPLTTLVVSSLQALNTARGHAAIENRLPIITHEQWGEWCYEMTNAIMERIEHHGGDPNGRRDAA